MNSRATADQVVLEIVRAADGVLCGKTRLFKAFYFAHLDYFDKNPDTLTNWPIARMPQGPGIGDSETLFNSLQADGLLEVELVHDYVYPEYRFSLTEKGRELPKLEEAAMASIRRAVDYVKDKTAWTLSQMTHEHSRSWMQAKDGEHLNIYIDLIPEDDYVKRDRHLDELRDIF